MDFYSRKIIGWAYETTITVALTVKAVKNAYLNVEDPSGIILTVILELSTQATSLNAILPRKKSIIHLVVRDALTIIPA